MNATHAGPIELRSSALDAAWIRGAVEIERVDGTLTPHRLPGWARRRVNDPFMVGTSAEAAGIRLAVRTAATVIEIDFDGTRMVENEQVDIQPGTWQLVEAGHVVETAQAASKGRYVFSFDAPTGLRIPAHTPSTVRFDTQATGGERDLEIWLPYTDAVRLRALRADAPVAASERPAQRPKWVHYGSSISHGYQATAPTGTWPAVAALSSDVELTSLAFAGGAMLDPFVARVIRDQPADLISIKVGINLVNSDVMRLRAFGPALQGFLDTIREGHPHTPIVLVSPIWCEPVETVSGPTIEIARNGGKWTVATGTAADVAAGKLSLHVIRREIAAVVAERSDSDTALSYVDGLRLYGAEDARLLPLPDNLHPSPEVQELIGRRWAALVFAERAKGGQTSGSR
ncbi:GDSL-type esterase/lipase family protein [Glaciibacter psychrotolerans]|uniref:SGNH hydrolase-type esterase domain-containing protein n=1 Tax=Glaciibacter psychrotolerans TaxID=670054 RepID=A0A7Z0J556_9MICO|nr:GDSL-type esterase/lipase family protein [Leifsonia psychrotolerans]NYJ18559.1 hypothetical protein [Leifsonia psychrotolerans]